MNFYPFSAIFDENTPICSILTCMQQICGRMQQQWHFWVNWKLIVLFYYQESQMIIFSPFEALFNEITNMMHFLPVCSKYAAVCSNRDFFLMSTPSRFFQHTKLALFPNFGALFLKITSGSHTAWTITHGRAGRTMDGRICPLTGP